MKICRAALIPLPCILPFSPPSNHRSHQRLISMQMRNPWGFDPKPLGSCTQTPYGFALKTPCLYPNDHMSLTQSAAIFAAPRSSRLGARCPTLRANSVTRPNRRDICRATFPCRDIFGLTGFDNRTIEQSEQSNNSSQALAPSRMQGNSDPSQICPFLPSSDTVYFTISTAIKPPSPSTSTTRRTTRPPAHRATAHRRPQRSKQFSYSASPTPPQKKNRRFNPGTNLR